MSFLSHCFVYIILKLLYINTSDIVRRFASYKTQMLLKDEKILVTVTYNTNSRLFNFH